MTRESEQHNSDGDATDELPVLSEEAIVAAGGELPELNDDRASDTGEFAVGVEDLEHAATRRMTAPPPRAPDSEAIQALERDVAELTSRWTKLEQFLAENADAVGSLRSELAASRAELKSSLSEQRDLAVRLEERESRLADAEAELEAERASAAGLRGELDALGHAKARVEEAMSAARTELEARQRELESTRAELDESRRRIETETEADEAATRGHLEEIEGLRNYIAGRAARWTEMEGLVAAQKERLTELEREMAQRVTRATQLEQTLHEETARADSLKTRVGELHETLEELTRSRDEALSRAARPSGDGRSGDEEIAAGRPLPPQDAGGEAGEKAELAARVEALEGALAALREMLGERERELASANEDRTALGAELSEAKADLDTTRGDLSRLQERLLERERSVDEQDRRVATLQHELAERLNTLRELQRSTRAANQDRTAAVGVEPPVEAGTPVLVCLTSEQPERHVLDKAEITIGRSSSCDIQILTHFVSREHAGLKRENGTVFIEDRGSTNGVFVNSVRVERQELKHGDWVTIGETQFRYLSQSAS